MLKVGTPVQVPVRIVQGTVKKLDAKDDGERVEYLVAYLDEAGAPTERWFREEQLVVKDGLDDGLALVAPLVSSSKEFDRAVAALAGLHDVKPEQVEVALGKLVSKETMAAILAERKAAEAATQETEQ
jgi:hypothetical protein